MRDDRRQFWSVYNRRVQVVAKRYFGYDVLAHNVRVYAQIFFECVRVSSVVYEGRRAEDDDTLNHITFF